MQGIVALAGQRQLLSTDLHHFGIDVLIERRLHEVDLDVLGGKPSSCADDNMTVEGQLTVVDVDLVNAVAHQTVEQWDLRPDRE